MSSDVANSSMEYLIHQLEMFALLSCPRLLNHLSVSLKLFLFMNIIFLFIVFLGLIVFHLCHGYAFCRVGIYDCLYILLSLFPPDDGS